ncbi:uncharacterized protein LOC123273312 isoform X2 [Cotesia glomerata]|uniref:uncharacterized protein LOC123273312 isoform X2 n=1 Tax=Cotesia glomerata TaxID=32391 RepID=UPI001D02C4DD|nr:uncharacterized protein LOC123273312 isoform X2 [Cotesia glomerata]
MSRPILSRPRTRVYDCNYDKGESYYKPMMDHLDRKYSTRPLFPESRGSFADEIAARRSDIGSRNLDGSNIEIERFFFDEYNPRICSEDNMDNNFVLMQRRLKDRATESFEEELAELRRKRRDLEDRLFDMIDVDAEIKQAENTLQNANSIFQKHATKFNNKEDLETEPINLIERLEKVRKPKEMSATLESSNENFMRKKNTLFKWSKFAELKSISPEYMDNMSRMNVAGKASTFKKSEGTASEKRRAKKQSVHRRRKQQDN